MTQSSTDRGWYYVRDERRFGPIPYDALSALAACGRLRATDPVWTPGLPDWVPAGEIERLIPSPPPSTADDRPTGAVPDRQDPPSGTRRLGSVPAVRTAAPGAAAAPPPQAGPAETAEPVAEGGGKRSNYLVRHWRGELSLAKSYWVNGVLLSVALNLGFALLETPLARSGFDLQTGAVAGLLFIGLLAAITLWQLVGIWRSATRSARTSGRRFWPRVAKGLVALNVVGAIFQIGTTGSDLMSILGALRDPELATYRIERRGDTDLLLVGAINERSAGEVIRALEDPSITILRVNSPGGLVDPAHRLGRYIRDNEMMVMAEGECISACVMVLAASPAAAIFPGTTVMFHRAEPLVEFANPELRRQQAQSLLEAVEIYREFGIADWAIETADRQQFWTPTLDQMIRMNLIDLIYDPEHERLVPAAGYCMGHPASCGGSPTPTPPAPTRSS
jgi:hypothetical protein